MLKNKFNYLFLFFLYYLNNYKILIKYMKKNNIKIYFYIIKFIYLFN